MKNDKLLNALNTLEEENLTLCLFNGSIYYKSIERGVKPLIELINSKVDYSNFVSVDKVIGKAAAFLYLKLNIKDIYCYIISEPALKVLNDNKVNVIYQEKVPFIRNRRNDGYCPMESLVLSVDSVEEAHNLLVNKINEGV